jgi:hypothetical protein
MQIDPDLMLIMPLRLDANDCKRDLKNLQLMDIRQPALFRALRRNHKYRRKSESDFPR